MIDRILVQKPDQKLVKDISLFRGAKLGATDHRLVITKIALTSHPFKGPSRIKSMKFELMNIKDSLTLATCRAECRNNIRAYITNRPPHSTVEEDWKTLKTRMVETVEKVIGKKRPCQKPWITATLSHW